jgi:hypothetical protein
LRHAFASELRMKGVPLRGRGWWQSRGRRVAVRLLAAASALASAGSEAAPPLQLQLEALYPLAQRSARSSPAPRNAADTVAAAADTPAPAEARRAEPAYGASAARTTLLEMPADVVPGRYSRPKYALGFRSDTMKGLARDMGLDADTCLAPLVRARVSLSQDSGGSGRLMVFARCTFH